MKRYYWDRKSDCDCEIVEQHDGAMVDYDEHVAVVAELEARCAELAAENAGLKESRQRLAEFIHEELDADYPLNMDIEIPSTDSFLAEVRAQGVEMAIEHIEQTICPNHETILSEFADQIRKGGAE